MTDYILNEVFFQFLGYRNKNALLEALEKVKVGNNIVTFTRFDAYALQPRQQYQTFFVQFYL